MEGLSVTPAVHPLAQINSNGTCAQNSRCTWGCLDRQCLSSMHKSPLLVRHYWTQKGVTTPGGCFPFFSWGGGSTCGSCSPPLTHSHSLLLHCSLKSVVFVTLYIYCMLQLALALMIWSQTVPTSSSLCAAVAVAYCVRSG